MSQENRRLRIVIDTNVLFSALALPKDSPPARVVELARTNRVELFFSAFILDELEKNLMKKAGWDAERVLVLRKRFKSFAAVVEPGRTVDVIKSTPADNRILECALEAAADALVTGNMKDIRPLKAFEGVEILTPREFLVKHFPNMA